MANVKINVNLDAKCSRCGKGGATQSGLCMECIAKGVRNGEYDHILKPLRDKTKRKLTNPTPGETEK